VVLTFTGLAGDSVAGTTGNQTTYLQFNMCGNVCNGGGVAILTKLATVIANRRPYAVTLNEVCENQFARLEARLAGYEGRFDPTGPVCRNGARYGNAALLRTREVSLVGSWSLPNLAGREPRRLMCVGGVDPAIVCVTHISTQPVDIGAQLRTVASVLNGLSSGASVVLGGDFNVDPPTPGCTRSGWSGRASRTRRRSAATGTTTCSCPAAGPRSRPSPSTHPTACPTTRHCGRPP
jgi:endonuclease/exonuclease/phosphatase family metal-dependent hydrolase